MDKNKSEYLKELRTSFFGGYNPIDVEELLDTMLKQKNALETELLVYQSTQKTTKVYKHEDFISFDTQELWRRCIFLRVQRGES